MWYDFINYTHISVIETVLVSDIDCYFIIKNYLQFYEKLVIKFTTSGWC